MGKVLKVREIGDTILKQKCEEVPLKEIENGIINTTIDDLKETLQFGIGYGIAAPQIGVNKRIIVIEVKKEGSKYDDVEDIPITAMINPTWKKLSDLTDKQYEACLSVPSVKGKVERYKEIELTYYTKKGEKTIKNINGFLARLVQHECDHLDGITFLERVDGNNFATAEMIEKYSLRNM